MGHTRGKRGFTLVELMVVIGIIALLIGLLMPALGSTHDAGRLMVSMANLRGLGTAHATYASEWNGRQWTVTPDDLTVILRESGNGYLWRYAEEDGAPEYLIPAVPLGFDRNGRWHETRRHIAMAPYYQPRPGGCRGGNYLYYHTRPFNQYMNGKFFDRMFWAPKDYVLEAWVRDAWEDPGEWPVGRRIRTFWSTYAMSMAAQFSPQVMARDSVGYRHPLRLAAGHRTPNLASARYPELKTHMLEMWWLQGPPSEHIPGSRAPWLFNLGQDSTPATLFYDGHVRLLGVREAVRSNARVVQQGGDSLVISSDPGCSGRNLWFENRAYNGQRVSSFHMYTADGILGRDTTGE